MEETYRLRWPYAAMKAVPAAGGFVSAPVLLWALGRALSVEATLVVVVLAVAVVAVQVSIMRAWRLVLGPEEVVVVRQRARITLRWSDFQEVKAVAPGRDKLVFSAGRVETANPVVRLSKRVADQLRETGVDRTVELLLFLPDWRKTDLPQAVLRAQAQQAG
ncbi:hypothetical protein [Actinokineospora iranica]|uniref:PH domain-containing protein n=1 Tax=Actinokineospora iranica TaxID=1271860 RepID=A0A1G6RHS1_9PSEU|nr:hypothetical protein [Actinokineospora iranica]SDD04200.1 hypothetical protein SAMN05216174_106359 [Actinokineospora iranica]